MDDTVTMEGTVCWGNYTVRKLNSEGIIDYSEETIQ